VSSSDGDLSQMSMLDMFRMEAESQAQTLTAGLLALERDPDALDQTEACMRAAHSLKGAARIVGLSVGASVAHAMEDCFVAVQQGRIKLHQRQTDLLLQGVDLLLRIAKTPEAEAARWGAEGKAEIDAFLAALARVLKGDSGEAVGETTTGRRKDDAGSPQSFAAAEHAPSAGSDAIDRVLRVTPEHLNRLLGLAGESLVESRWLSPFGTSLLRLKRMHGEAGRMLDVLRDALAGQTLSEQTQSVLAESQRRVMECQQFLLQRLVELEMYDRNSVDLSHRLYEAALACRMRPFADGTQAWPRVVRDLGRSLGKKVQLKITGETTQVDRDILQQLEAPLGHLLRNAVDHGIESADERRAAGKPEEGIVRLEARHNSGVLQVLVSDDGRGVNLESLRAAVLQRGLTNAETAAQLSEAELLKFLFLPGFTMREAVTEISGRGVGLDVVQEMVKQVRGAVRVTSEPGKGTCFQMQLPLTLSVLRTMLVNIGGEPYAFPLAHLERTLKIPRDRIELLQGRQYFHLDGRQIGLATAPQILEVDEPELSGDISVIVVRRDDNLYGLVVDGFLGERELVVQPLDARLGKIKNITAGALTENGLPVLIVDVEDMILTLEKLVSVGDLSKVRGEASADQTRHRKRVLVVDDSLTVRELERKLLSNQGYNVEIAVDGMDGWNAVRTGEFDLVVTDIDMPRMDGIELVTLIKKHTNLKSLPVLVVSYKDREEDRQRGLNAGADYYLTKGSFHDDTLLQAVVDLIGEADA
jgi:two-component system sensor histidine kinase and response regulator WspE